MAGVQASAGIVGEAEVNSGMSGAGKSGAISGALSNPATWSVIWFVLAVGFLVFIYLGFGGHRGQVSN